MMIDKAFWAGKRVFVTGHTGFKGSWLALWLAQLDAEVTGFALAAPDDEPNLYSQANVGATLNSVVGDVRDLDAVRAAVEAARPEIVLHLAAQSLVRPSYRDPVATYATNVLGTVHVLEAVRQTPGVRAVVVVTSDKCYENQEWLWPYRENEPMGGHDPYSNSKGCAELVTAAYRASFFAGTTGAPAVASARAGNVIGGGDWAEDRLVPDIVRAALAGDPVSIRAPHAVRPWQHVLEPLAGYLMLAERLVHDGQDVAEAWNFGPDDHDARPVGWLVEQLAERWGDGFQWTRDDGPKPHEASLLKLDASKAKSRLDWHPVLRLEQALDWIVDWYRLFSTDSDLGLATNAQIRSYRHALAAD